MSKKILQLSATEYQLFYGMLPIEYVRFVSNELISVPVADNSSPVRNLVKRLSEVGCASSVQNNLFVVFP